MDIFVINKGTWIFCMKALQVHTYSNFYTPWRPRSGKRWLSGPPAAPEEDARRRLYLAKWAKPVGPALTRH